MARIIFSLVYTRAAMYPCSFYFHFYRRIYEEVVIYEYNDPSSTLLLSIRVHTVYVSVSTSRSHVRICPSFFYLCACPFGPPDIARHLPLQFSSVPFRAIEKRPHRPAVRELPRPHQELPPGGSLHPEQRH